MAKKREVSAIIGAVLVILLGLATFFFVRSFEAAPTPSVEGNEEPGEQPAGPADPSALPGNQNQ